ncbi:hypothetical protein P167DRAFT_547941 [Morchella conica CCBAS932]|uniref:Uncharacterized protein n=1 Tax=Morchella conica CCBAS932 TaxID=1392247 RepID=A0A3N4KG09_9PEZI|nr:hypothetical protein P167DRAFT_547941 [Morchella conica CCBAS932]
MTLPLSPSLSLQNTQTASYLGQEQPNGFPPPQLGNPNPVNNPNPNPSKTGPAGLLYIAYVKYDYIRMRWLGDVSPDKDITTCSLFVLFEVPKKPFVRNQYKQQLGLFTVGSTTLCDPRKLLNLHPTSKIQYDISFDYQLWVPQDPLAPTETEHNGPA